MWNKTLILFINSQGKVYRKLLKRKPYRCRIIKYFPYKANKNFRVILINLQDLKVKDLGRIKTY